MNYRIEVGSKWPYVLNDPERVPVPDDWVTENSYGNRHVHISKLGILTCEAGYAWDGPSGPAVDTASFLRASLFHDGLYQLIREGYVAKRPYRRLADKLMRQIAEKDGMGWARRWWTWTAVRLWGWAAVL